jgi:hypothetical protein
VKEESKPKRTAPSLFLSPAPNNAFILSFVPTTTVTLIIEQPTPTVYATARFSAVLQGPPWRRATHSTWMS